MKHRAVSLRQLNFLKILVVWYSGCRQQRAISLSRVVCHVRLYVTVSLAYTLPYVFVATDSFPGDGDVAWRVA